MISVKQKTAFLLIGLIGIVFLSAMAGAYFTEKELSDKDQARIQRLEQQRWSKDTTRQPTRETRTIIYSKGSAEFELGIKRESWTKYYGEAK